MVVVYRLELAASVTLHGTRPWYPYDQVLLGLNDVRSENFI